MAKLFVPSSPTELYWLMTKQWWDLHFYNCVPLRAYVHSKTGGLRLKAVAAAAAAAMLHIIIRSHGRFDSCRAINRKYSIDVWNTIKHRGLLQATFGLGSWSCWPGKVECIIDEWDRRIRRILFNTIGYNAYQLVGERASHSIGPIIDTINLGLACNTGTEHLRAKRWTAANDDVINTKKPQTPFISIAAIATIKPI